MQRSFCLLFFFCIAFSTSGCAQRQLNYGAANVVLYANKNIPKSCSFLGNISNSNVHADVDLRSSLQYTENDDIIFLKNEGAKLGANVVVLVEHKSVEDYPRYMRGFSNIITPYGHAIKAKAYMCPSRIQNLNQKPISNLEIIQETPLVKS